MWTIDKEPETIQKKIRTGDTKRIKVYERKNMAHTQTSKTGKTSIKIWKKNTQIKSDTVES